MTVRAQDRRSRNPNSGPLFFDRAVGLEATWDVWVSTGATAEHHGLLAHSRFHALVELARQHSSFYRELYRHIAPGECCINEMPIVRKRELMANFDATVTDSAVSAAAVRRFLSDANLVGHPFLDRYAVWTSSGTTGEPAIYVHDSRALAIYESLQMVRFRGLQSPAALAAASLAHERYAFVGATGGHFAGTATVARLGLLYPWLADHVRTFSILQPAAALTRQLNDYQPRLLATYPTSAQVLAHCQQSGQLAIQPREIWTGGEGLSPAQRIQIADTFGCVVRDDYGASEFLSIAFACNEGTLHLNADWVVLEPVDAQYRPVPPGVASHTALLTNLVNTVQPLIRYDLGDSITVLEQPCSCGSALPAIRVEGRCDDVVVLSDIAGRGVALLPLALTTVLEDEAGVYRFQLLQTSESALHLRLDPTLAETDAGRCREALGTFLSAQGLRNVRLDIEREPLQRNPVSGKLQRVRAGA